jgi:imidazolonepropionase-like amidohydrolase
VSLSLLLACAESPAAGGRVSAPASFVLQGGTVVGTGVADVVVREGRIVAVGGKNETGLPVIDATGTWVVPGVIDSHVHLRYLPAGDEMVAGGVVGAVDLAAPLDFVGERPGGLQMVHTGPMITAAGGYPTRSWGAAGYGLEVSDVASAVAAVDQLDALGVAAVKLPVTGDPVLDDSALIAAADRAHALKLRVASHAVGDASAARARAIGADALAHTPTETLSSATVDAWRHGAVVSTLRAFGGGSATIGNLTRLREAGATVLYGTDFGNTRDAGVDKAELELLVAAGLDGAAILEASTAAPAAFWGMEGLGAVAPGMRASLLLLATDPLVDPLALASPSAVFLDGVERSGGVRRR